MVVELKAPLVKPRTPASFYFAAVDAQVKALDGKPTASLLLCKQQNRLVKKMRV